jgi:hypothetical protein
MTDLLIKKEKTIDRMIERLNKRLNNCNLEVDIVIGSKIKLYSNDEIYIFYGYNYDRTIICCFPVNTNSVIDNMKYVSISEIENVF